MQLQHIELENLKPTNLNVRKKGAKDIRDLVPSIRSLGLIQPLLVRPNCEGFEIVAGQRRYYALQKLSSEAEIDPVPCIVMKEGDDARAIEASLAENIARLPMDEIDQYKAFAALIKQGKSVEEIAARFGISERLVTQRLAIANLIGPILTSYSKGDIHPSTIRILTMATKKQQKAWLALFNSEEEHAPEGYRLKCWLFGGADIPVEHALFDLEAYKGSIVSDLFGEERYFDDAATFWDLQNKAIGEAKDRYLSEGWADVIALEIGEYFRAYEHVDTAKEDGGKVYIVPSRNGGVTFYEGQLPRKEAKAKLKNGQDKERDVNSRPELTKAMQNYLDLYRHAAVRAELLGHQGVALRLVLAQMIAGSSLYEVHAEPQKASNEAISDSLAGKKAEMLFAEERQRVLALLGLDEKQDHLVYRKEDWDKSRNLHAIFGQLLKLDDASVSMILAYVAAETLPSGSALVEALGNHLSVDMAEVWRPDQTFLDLLRDKQTINAIVKDIAGKNAADAHITSTAKVQKQVIEACLNGSRKAAKKDWQPKYMAFPMSAYTKQGGISAIKEWKAVKKHYR